MGYSGSKPAEASIVADIFLSDVHLRLDRPERSARLARVVNPLGSGDRLFIVGDLCDFWFASRQAGSSSGACEGLRSLRDFRDRGGELVLLPGNHDHLLDRFYRRELGTGFVGDDLDLTVAGLRIHLVHGHLVGARKAWKGLMEGRAFLRFFRLLPGPIASRLEATLERNNEKHLAETERHHKAIYRRVADSLAGSTDLVVFGHIHTACDDRSGDPRFIILGGWHGRSSYLRIDGESIEVIHEDAPVHEPPRYADRT